MISFFDRLNATVSSSSVDQSFNLSLIMLPQSGYILAIAPCENQKIKHPILWDGILFVYYQ
ncbi:MAG: hypothetical protein VKL41_05890 [Snowella sp.]|nr:hypothetical protein [Snowella sp.]